MPFWFKGKGLVETDAGETCFGANLMVGQTCTVGELALGKLDWANLHWAKDRRPGLGHAVWNK